MRKKTLALLLSILIILMPFLGFPTTLKTVFYVVAGILLVLLIELLTFSYHDIKNKNVGCALDDIKDENDIGEDKEKNSDKISKRHMSRDDYLDLLKTEEGIIDETTLQEYATHEKQPKNKHKKD